jgi:hypothetical protein
MHLTNQKEEFDDMFDIPTLYISARSYSIQWVRLHPILLMSILLYHFKQLTDYNEQVKQMEPGRKFIVVRERKRMRRLTALPSIEVVMIPKP